MRDRAGKPRADSKKAPVASAKKKIAHRTRSRGKPGKASPQAGPAAAAAGLRRQVAALKAELGAARQQQSAGGDILRAISRSSFDLQQLLETLTVSSARLCDADMSGMARRRQDGSYHHVASFNFTEDWIDYNKNIRLEPGRGSVVGRVLLERRAVQVADVLADPEYTFLEPARKAGFRTFLGVPLMRDGEPVGILTLGRRSVRPFTDAQIALLSTFADQAVIAIENTRLFDELQGRTRELGEALEQQTATNVVLKVISRSAFDLETVLKTLVESAARLCEADIGTIRFRDGESFRLAATYGCAPEWQEHFARYSTKPDRGSVFGRTIIEGRVVHLPDVLADPEFTRTRMDAQKLMGFRAALGVPLLREGGVLGVLNLFRSTPRSFTEKQIALVSTFADQAVIAIENARLFGEVQARTVELSESLQQQTATNDVLKVISRSAFDLQAVLDVLVESAGRLCEADMVNIWRPDGSVFALAASYRPAAEHVNYLKSQPISPGRGSCVGRTLLEGKVVQIEDIHRDPEYALELSRLEGYRTMLGIPLLREGIPIGVIALVRSERRRFTDRQIELASSFADQAVIAIENTRLFDEVRQRTEELTESLRQQTATADVLKVISRSAFDLQVVLQTLVQSAAQLCNAEMVSVTRPRGHGDAHYHVASVGFAPEWFENMQTHPLVPERGTLIGRTLLEARTVHIPDVLADPEYTATRAQQLGRFRAILGVPLLRDGTAIGVFMLARSTPQQFTNKQIELASTFADQAVIAIENARLLAELRESLNQQTATADVLKVISRSTFDLRTVLQTLVESAARLCEADQGTITREQDGVFYRAGSYGFSEAFNRAIADIPVESERGSATGRALYESRVVHIPDVEADPEYTFAAAKKLGGFRTILAVPMLREKVAIGVLVLTRIEKRPFSDKQLELASTFADQAAIAIENVRLFDRAEARTRELARSLEELRAAQDRLVQTEKLASLGQLTAGIAHEIKNPLNFVNNFSSVSVELIDELRLALGPAGLDDATRSEVEDLTGMLRDNLAKVVQHGKRADSIVKNMLLHSREGAGERRPVDINGVVEESLNLAYHGARAERPGFNITLERSLDPAAGQVDLFPQEITRVLLNLISNGFYAASKRRTVADSDGYEPTLSAATRDLGDRVEITIRDNGTGIPPDIREKIFNPFFTTKPAGEGTGLGLSLSHDIVVKQHAGTIEVESEPGRFTLFRIVLPRGAAPATKTGEGR